MGSNVFFIPGQKSLIQIFHTVFWLHNNLCESKPLEHKFNRWFCNQKTVLNVHTKKSESRISIKEPEIQKTKFLNREYYKRSI